MLEVLEVLELQDVLVVLVCVSCVTGCLWGVSASFCTTFKIVTAYSKAFVKHRCVSRV